MALAGQVLVGAREMRALGVESAYSMVDLVGEERAFGGARGALADARPAGGPHVVPLRSGGRELFGITAVWDH